MPVTRFKEEARWTPEDKLLLAYWRQVGGTLFTEVIVGRGGLRPYPSGTKPRRIDGVRIVPAAGVTAQPSVVTFNRRVNAHEFEHAVAGSTVEVIEVKMALNRGVIGQVIVGADVLAIEYEPRSVQQVILCAAGDTLLERVCEQHGIAAWVAGSRLI